MRNPTRTFFRAEIYLNAQRIKKMDGKYNSREQLDRFIRDNWPGDLKYHAVGDDQDELILKVYKYHGKLLYDVWITAKMPRPKGYGVSANSNDPHIIF